MKTIGLIGGMGWPSTAQYYRIINETVNERLGGVHSAKIVMHSVDLAEIERLQRADEWDAAADRMIEIARGLGLAGADCILICCNTMHKVAGKVADAIEMPLINIVDAVGQEVQKLKIKHAGLLGSQVVTEDRFYAERLSGGYGLEVVVPDAAQRKFVHEIIYNELCRGRISKAAQDGCGRIIQSLVSRGAEAVILGCTELILLLEDLDFGVPLLDTTGIHAAAAAAFALDD